MPSERYHGGLPSGGGTATGAGAILPLTVVVTGPDDLLPDQLTERLRVSGARPFGRVTAIHPGEPRPMILSTIMPLRVEYSPEAPGEAPTRLLLKSSRDGLDAGLQSFVGEREVAVH